MNYTEPHILEAVEAVVSTADPCGFDTLNMPSLTVADRAAVKRLKTVLERARQNNAKARDLNYLIRQALDSQRAANPRPISVMLSNAIHTVMLNGGNPAFEESPLVRLILNTLLNIMKFRNLPHYNEDGSLYGKDIDALEAILAPVEQNA